MSVGSVLISFWSPSHSTRHRVRLHQTPRDPGGLSRPASFARQTGSRDRPTPLVKAKDEQGIRWLVFKQHGRFLREDLHEAESVEKSMDIVKRDFLSHDEPLL